MNESEFPVALTGTNSSTLMWAHEHEIEAMAINQLRNISKLPWVHGLRVMPDVHLGKGATVGSVIGMIDAVAPNAVGVDIGCGMGAVRTNLTLNDLPHDLKPIRLAIESVVPVGFMGHSGSAAVLREDQSLATAFASLFNRFDQLKAPKLKDRRNKAQSQCGSLGGGNHFIELCYAEEDDRIWITLHSGSRNIGKEIAERHYAIAKPLQHNSVLPDKALAVLLRGTPELENYLHDLYWAQEYAFLNRRIMLALICSELADFYPEITFEPPVLCHHNYVAEEHHDGIDMIVTRKGAIRAANGDMGLIPGSMGTGSYLVRGLGNEAAYCSASHGAGRKMSRSAAKARFSLQDLQEQTKGVECRKDQGVLDEIPAAYKSIESVMAAQVDLVEVINRLQTLLCVKG